MQSEALFHTPDTATEPTLVVDRLKAYYTTKAFGIDRDIRAVDDISLSIAKGEIYGVAGESS
ncbi:MAG: transporter ATP-binding protein, partial [Proteobacteria bacterium]|nr:transporter ATP-binding protein [Pseudomonadota bacterium]